MGYPDGDTWRERLAPSAIPFPDMEPTDPTGRFDLPGTDATFSSPSLNARIMSDGSALTQDHGGEPIASTAQFTPPAA